MKLLVTCVVILLAAILLISIGRNLFEAGKANQQTQEEIQRKTQEDLKIK